MAKNDAPFTISETGETTGEKWTGKFKAKTVLSHRDYIEKDKLRRRLLGDMGGTPDDRVAGIALAVSEIAIRITEAPKWWDAMDNGLELSDDNVLRQIFLECLRIEREAFEERKKLADGVEIELKKELQKEE